MANHKSAAKRASQSVRKNAVNNKRRKIVKTIEKKVVLAISEKKADVAQELMKTLSSLIDRAAKTRVVSKNHASRKKSRLSSRISALSK